MWFNLQILLPGQIQGANTFEWGGVSHVDLNPKFSQLEMNPRLDNRNRRQFIVIYKYRIFIGYIVGRHVNLAGLVVE